MVVNACDKVIQELGVVAYKLDGEGYKYRQHIIFWQWYNLKSFISQMKHGQKNILFTQPTYTETKSSIATK